MICPVCFQPVDQMTARSSYTEVVCYGCGLFQISNTLRPALRRSLFDVEPARQRLEQRRQSSPMPMLGAADEDLLLPR